MSQSIRRRPPPSRKTVDVKIDFDKIGQRIISLNVPAADYNNLTAGAAGTVFYTQPAGTGPASGLRLQKYQLKERTAATFLEGVRYYTLSGDRKKLLYQAGGARWGVVPTDKPPKPATARSKWTTCR